MKYGLFPTCGCSSEGVSPGCECLIAAIDGSEKTTQALPLAMTTSLFFIDFFTDINDSDYVTVLP